MSFNIHNMLYIFLISKNEICTKGVIAQFEITDEPLIKVQK